MAVHLSVDQAPQGAVVGVRNGKVAPCKLV
jgi:hypothetical protein